ncbi:hypothetical protein BGZ96_004303 [Linnemannia gamsii]|uniref:Histone chaperone RTT106/FACT complex subunit SPT16-like middle domain-containing protein n=1 Tax=Linnemannia gamsii TaxID=64522 RepID=A0ABQ7K6S2_9FUNG|nr:hypothetical protein BGZ96_004303 [Linnemannia gamsii]
MPLPQKLVAAAIPDDQDLATAVQAIVKTHPDISPTITRLLTYIQTKQNNTSSSSNASSAKPAQGIAQFFNKPAASNTTTSTTITTATGAAGGAIVPDAPIGPPIYSTNPLSFLHPARKKFVLSLHKSHIALVSATSATDIVFKAPYESLYRVVAVPFLERATKQTALILFFRHSAFAAGGSAKDAIWAVPLPDDGKDFSLHVHASQLGLVGLSQDLRITTLSKEQPPLAFVNPPTVTGPTKRPDHIFLSVLSYFLKHSDISKTGNVMDRIIPNPTPAYPNFSAHLKSNQGTIYLLPTGILFAFRKPILFLRAAAIEAVGIHSVLTRTFDFEIVMDTTTLSSDGNGSGGRDNGKDESRRGSTVEDLEGIPPENKDGRRAIGFGMVDTKEFARMEEWIKKAGIRDRSMSEDLKAKDKAPVVAGSGKKRERAADSGDGEEEEGGSAQKAAKGEHEGGADEDSDDEDDDDFAPESDDELMEEYDSNAEGSDSDGGGAEEEVEESGKKAKKTTGAAGRKSGQKKLQEEDVDLDEESLGEDSDEDEDEDEDEED